MQKSDNTLFRNLFSFFFASLDYAIIIFEQQQRQQQQYIVVAEKKESNCKKVVAVAWAKDVKWMCDATVKIKQKIIIAWTILQAIVAVSHASETETDS